MPGIVFQADEPIFQIERSCLVIDRIDLDRMHTQLFRKIKASGKCVDQEFFAKLLALARSVDRQSGDQNDGYWMFRQCAGGFFRQMLERHAARCQSVVSADPRLPLSHRDESTTKIPFFVLSDEPPNEIIERRFSAGKLRTIMRTVDPFDPPLRHDGRYGGMLHASTLRSQQADDRSDRGTGRDPDRSVAWQTSR